MRLIFLFFTFIYFNTSEAQLTPVDRNTGRVIPCDELGCYEVDSTYEASDRICLNCFYRVSDSTMRAMKSTIIQKCTNAGKNSSLFKKEQTFWEANREKEASKEADKYKGGTMEMTEYVRTKLVMTKKRIIYLRNYLGKL